SYGWYFPLSAQPVEPQAEASQNTTGSISTSGTNTGNALHPLELIPEERLEDNETDPPPYGAISSGRDQQVGNNLPEYWDVFGETPLERLPPSPPAYSEQSPHDYSHLNLPTVITSKSVEDYNTGVNFTWNKWESLDDFETALPLHLMYMGKGDLGIIMFTKMFEIFHHRAHRVEGNIKEITWDVQSRMAYLAAIYNGDANLFNRIKEVNTDWDHSSLYVHYLYLAIVLDATSIVEMLLPQINCNDSYRFSEFITEKCLIVKKWLVQHPHFENVQGFNEELDKVELPHGWHPWEEIPHFSQNIIGPIATIPEDQNVDLDQLLLTSIAHAPFTYATAKSKSETAQSKGNI
ncbi:hypothetical protein IWQ62_005752, partial [Dispira parvispora]